MVKYIKNLFLFLLPVIIFTALTLAYFSRRSSSPLLRNHSRDPQITSGSIFNFSLEDSPRSAIRGAITELKGDVLWKSRVATQSSSLSSGTKIQQGEEVETKEVGNLTIEFGEGQSVQILPKSDLNIVQALPDNLVFQQTDGTVIYKNSTGLPLAVRSLGLITQFSNGEARIIINKKTSIVSVEVIKGTLNSAYNDSRYVTRVLKTGQGKKLIFNNVKKLSTIK